VTLYNFLNYHGKIEVSDSESRKLQFFDLSHLPAMESRAANIMKLIKDGKIQI